MKQLLKTTCLSLVLALLPANLLAGDFSNLNFIGFSRDGKYLAFEEYGEKDKNEGGYSSVFFVDTLKNDFAAPAVSFVINDFDGGDVAEKPFSFYEDPAARKRAQLAAAPFLRKFGIISGNTGHQVISRLLSDVTDVNNLDVKLGEPKSVVFAPDRRERWLNGRFNLTLKTVAQKQFCKKSDDLELLEFVMPNGESLPKISVNPNRKKNDKDKQTIFSFELALENDDQHQTTILQKALEVPLNRGCAIDYRINSVYLYRNYIAVFVGVIKPGWGGDNIRLMVVTGKIS